MGECGAAVVDLILFSISFSPSYHMGRAYLPIALILGLSMWLLSQWNVDRRDSVTFLKWSLRTIMNFCFLLHYCHWHWNHTPFSHYLFSPGARIRNTWSKYKFKRDPGVMLNQAHLSPVRSRCSGCKIIKKERKDCFVLFCFKTLSSVVCYCSKNWTIEHKMRYYV